LRATAKAAEPPRARRAGPRPDPRSLRDSRVALRERLASRRAELEQAIVTRLHALAAPSETRDPEYLAGLRGALTAALDYALAAIERGEERAPQVPPSLLAQARLAARHGVSLDTVLRRYLAGYSLLGEFAIEEAEAGELLRGGSLRHILRGQAALLDRLIAAVSEEHAREAEGRVSSLEQRRARRIERLLAGEPLDASELGYELDAHHLAAIARGPGAAEALRELAAALDARLLLIRREEETAWAWLGSRRAVQLERLGRSTLPPGLCLALGEPAQGLPGWRLSHRQANAALQIALRSPGCITRYAEVALLASILQDELLSASLRELYLKPLEAERDGGETLRQTLRAYFGAGRNASSAAATLGVNRNTIAERIRAIEAAIGCPLSSCGPELEIALRLAESDGLRPR
jgi:hypothetical protein